MGRALRSWPVFQVMDVMNNSLKQLIYCQQRKTLEAHPKTHLQLRLQERPLCPASLPYQSRDPAPGNHLLTKATPPSHETLSFVLKISIKSTLFCLPIVSFPSPLLLSFSPSLPPCFSFFPTSSLFKTTPRSTLHHQKSSVAGQTEEDTGGWPVHSQAPSGTFDSSPLSISPEVRGAGGKGHAELV